MFDQAELANLPDVALSERVLELFAEMQRVHAELMCTVAAWDAKGAWRADGAVDPRAWLSSRASMTKPEALRMVRSARLLRQHERTAKALASGVVAPSQVDAL